MTQLSAQAREATAATHRVKAARTRCLVTTQGIGAGHIPGSRRERPRVGLDAVQVDAGVADVAVVLGGAEQGGADERGPGWVATNGLARVAQLGRDKRGGCSIFAGAGAGAGAPASAHAEPHRPGLLVDPELVGASRGSAGMRVVP